MRQTSDTYFVRLTPDGPPPGEGAPGRASKKRRERVGTSPSTTKRRRRKPVSGKNIFVALLIIGLGTWLLWASQRPGGVSGTIDGWIKHVRGDVASVSADPDAAKARRYYQGQYASTGVYPQLSDSDLAAVGVGVGVSIDWCTPHAIVIQGATGGGFSSRLLLSGKDLGELPGRINCPGNLANPAPWSFTKK